MRLAFCTLSRRPSPVAKKRSKALSLNDRITLNCKATPYNCQALPYDPRIYGDLDLNSSLCPIKGSRADLLILRYVPEAA